MSLLDDLARNLSTAQALLDNLPDEPSVQTVTIVEIETLVHPAIKTATRLMIQTEARRLVESDRTTLMELDATLAILSCLLTQAEILLQHLPRTR
jgi:hypothetical protein